MALLYLGYKLFDVCGFEFRKAENTTEKCISTYCKVNFEQTLLSAEFGVYVLIFQTLCGKLNRQLYKKTYCQYNYNKHLKEISVYGGLFAFPITTYRTIEYCKNKDHQIINF